MRSVMELPSPSQLKGGLAASPGALGVKARRDAEIGAILRGEDARLLLLVGPCSAHDPAAVVEYAHLLAELAGDVARQILIVPRVYTAKPRTDCRGFLGLLHEPEGLFAARKLHLDILEQTGLSTADELLYPSLLPYFDDLVSYFAVGARSVENQEHRLVASGLAVPVGMKNPLSGNLEAMMAAVSAARGPHSFIFGGHLVETAGNPLAHGILRGGAAPNYHQEILAALAHPVIVDCNHGNSGKNPKLQRQVALDVLKSRKEQPLAQVRGLMIESFIQGGHGQGHGQSITDPCLSWADTKALVHEISTI